MKRVSIIGPSGSGKSTLAQQLGPMLGASITELDELFHRPNWEPTPTPEFRAKVTEALDTDRWVVAGNYSIAMDLVHGQADTIVWLDFPRWLVTWRVIRRSLRRVITREELWNGNRERWRYLIKRDPEENIIMWAWVSQPKNRAQYEALVGGPMWANTDLLRLTSRRDVRQFLRDAR